MPELGVGGALTRALVAAPYQIVHIGPALLDGDAEHRGAHGLGRGPGGADPVDRARAHVALVYDLAVLDDDVAYTAAHVGLRREVRGLERSRGQPLALRRRNLPRARARAQAALLLPRAG